MNRRELLKQALGWGAVALLPAIPMIAQTPPAKPAVGKLILDVRKFPGATLGHKLQAAYDALPVAGGVLDCTGFRGPQTTGGVSVKIRKPTDVIFGNADIYLSRVGAQRPGEAFLDIGADGCVVKSISCVETGLISDLDAIQC